MGHELNTDNLTFMERLMQMKEKYGYWKLTKLVVFVGFAIAFLFAMKKCGDNFSIEKQKEFATTFINKQKQIEHDTHEEAMKERDDIKPVISEILRNCLADMEADRAFVLEMHNGSMNASGLPFVHASMTYEEVRDKVEGIDEDYQNLTLSRFNFPMYLKEHTIWYGSIPELAKIDNKLAIRLQHNDATYVVFAIIKNEKYQIGYFGFSYTHGHEPKSEHEIIEYVVRSVQVLARTLDNTTIKK